MAIKHNYLNVAGKKPTQAESSLAELIPNFADGTLWTENVSGTVVQINKIPESITGHNLIINGGFDVWQRGDTFSPATAGTFTADRWFSSGGVNISVSKEIVVTNEVRYAIGIDISTSSSRLTQIIENGIELYDGKTMTFSVWTNTGNPNMEYVGVSSSATTPTSGTEVLLSATGETDGIYERYSGIFACPSTGTHLAVMFKNLGSTSHLSNVKLELGSTATKFNVENITDVENQCYKYYWKTIKSLTLNAITNTAHDQRRLEIQFPVIMRITPTITDNGWSTVNGTPSGSLALTSINTQYSRIVFNNSTADAAVAVNANAGIEYDAEI